MKMKKWLLTGACASMMGGFAACSSDDSNPVTQVPVVDPGLSSSAVVAQIPGSSTDQPVTWYLVLLLQIPMNRRWPVLKSCTMLTAIPSWNG